MFLVSSLKHSIKSKTSSLFKLSLLLILYIYNDNPILLVAILIYLFLSDKKICLLGLILFSLISIRLNYTIDVIDYGIIERVNDYSIVVKKPFYSIILNTDKEFNYGDLIRYDATLNDLKKIDNISNLRKNIFFEGKLEDYEVIKENKNLRIKLYEHIDNDYDDKTSAYLSKFLLYQNDYDELSPFYLSFGFAFYYLLKAIDSKTNNKYLSSTLIIIHIIFFGIQNHIILFFLNMFVNEHFKNRIERFCIFIITLALISPFLFYSYTFIIPIIIKLYRIIDNPLRFKSLLLMIQSYLFSNISLFRSLFYKYYCYLTVIIYLFSILVLIFPMFSGTYVIFLESIELFINNYDIAITGKINIFYILILLLIFNNFSWIKKYLQEIIILSIIYFKLINPFFSIDFIDVGQGDAIFISDKFLSNTILIDTGSPYNYHKLKRHLDKKGVEEIDYLIISHEDSDHSGNINSLIGDYEVKNIIREHIDISNDEFQLISLNSPIYDNENDNSLVYYLSVDNMSFLFLGDISKTVERNILKEIGPIEIDVVKLAHHGSNTSSDSNFLNDIKASIAIISTNGRYNHPSTETISTLNKLNIDYYKTNDMGTISFIYTALSDFIITGDRDFVIIRNR